MEHERNDNDDARKKMLNDLVFNACDISLSIP